jgi:hypothetical protein
LQRLYLPDPSRGHTGVMRFDLEGGERGGFWL